MTENWLLRLTRLMNAAMLVVTTHAEGHQSRCLVGFATRASVHPLRFLVGLSRANHTVGVAERCPHVAVQVLSRRGSPTPPMT